MLNLQIAEHDSLNYESDTSYIKIKMTDLVLNRHID